MDKIYIVDASGYLYRSYFAIHYMTNARGESTNALFGFIRSLLKLMKDFEPSYLVAVFDGPRNAIRRTEMYADYKFHRKGTPGDLLYQLAWAQEYCQWMGIPLLIIPDVEADDTMGSVAVWAQDQGSTVYLCTSDKDMCQLVGERVFVLNTHKDNLILSSHEVVEQFGVFPHQMVDFLAITGDSSDNIPGIAGFGPKTAAELLKKFGSLDYILDHPEEVTGKKKQEIIRQEREKALMSRQLATINKEVPIPKEEEFYKIKAPSRDKLREFYSKMNFSSLIRELGSRLPVEEENLSYTLVDDEDALKELIEYLSNQKEICLDTETTAVRPLQAKLVGIGLGVEPEKAWYIPVNGKLGLERVLFLLKPLFDRQDIGFYGHNIKYDCHVLANYDIEVPICFDTILASYLLNSHNRQHSLDHLALEYFDKVKVPIEELIGKGKHQITMDKVPLNKVCYYCCEDVDYTVRLKRLLSKKLEERGLMSLFQEVELPLLPVLVGMERRGIFVDVPYLKRLATEVAIDIKRLEEEIYEMIGETFNINSTQQLGHILFNKMGIRPPKKTLTGYSTSAWVLESLKHEYPIASKILDYRTLEKLRSTYIESLPKEVNPKTHRIHCTFNQFVTATGRLSCQDPNLQNIPIRAEIGKRIREAFRPELPGWSYLAADYSQVELRLLAHLSEDPVLLEAFGSNEDIHLLTASLIFGISMDEVTREQRNQAKAVNFGIIYGQQAFGLAQELAIETRTAATFIERYFQRYRRVKEFLEESKEKARKEGKAVSFTGRERLIPEINSKNGVIRVAAERLAVNTPLQSAQADIMKKAMLQIEEKLRNEKKEAFMVLQIHDELIFEAPDKEIESLSKLVKETMERIVQLKIPLLVDIHIGKNWKEC